LVVQELTGRHTLPLPEYPVLQAHELVPGPVDVHDAFVSHPPPFTLQLLTAAHCLPFPE
jgi:hypothetical protein